MSGLNAERTVTRAEAAEYLREFADKLANGGHSDTTHATDRSTSGTTTSGSTTGDTTRHGSTDQTQQTTDQTQQTNQQGTETGGNRAATYGKVTFLVGNDSATVNPPEEVTLNVDVGEDSSMMSSGAETVTFSLHWDKEAVPESDELRIE